MAENVMYLTFNRGLYSSLFISLQVPIDCLLSWLSLCWSWRVMVTNILSSLHPQCPLAILFWKILELSTWPCLHLFRGRFKKHYRQVGKGVELWNDLVGSKYVYGNDNFLKPSRRVSISNLLFNQRKPTSNFVLWVQTLVLNNHFSYDFILHLTLTLSYILHRYHKWVTSRRLGKYQ